MCARPGAFRAARSLSQRGRQDRLACPLSARLIGAPAHAAPNRMRANQIRPPTQLQDQSCPQNSATASEAKCKSRKRARSGLIGALLQKHATLMQPNAPAAPLFGPPLEAHRSVRALASFVCAPVCLAGRFVAAQWPPAEPRLKSEGRDLIVSLAFEWPTLVVGPAEGQLTRAATRGGGNYYYIFQSIAELAARPAT